MQKLLLGILIFTWYGIALGETLYISHRGEHSTVPENTLSAFQLAWEQGADGAECDLHFSKDGAIVVFHDGDLRRLLPEGEARKLRDCTLEELQKLDLTPLLPRKIRNTTTSSEKIPTLAETLAIIPEGKVMYIEFKGGGLKLCEETANEIRNSKQPPERIRFISCNSQSIKTIRNLLPEYPAYVLMDIWDHKNNRLQELDELIKIAKDANATGINMRFRVEYWNESVVQKIHDAGLEVHCWTVDSLKHARIAKELGVDSITSNRAPFLKKELEEATHTP